MMTKCSPLFVAALLAPCARLSAQDEPAVQVAPEVLTAAFAPGQDEVFAR